jgi:cell division GTPase FtsZ
MGMGAGTGAGAAHAVMAVARTIGMDSLMMVEMCNVCFVYVEV